MTQYAIATDLNRCVELPELHGGLQGGEQRSHRQLLEQGAAHRSFSEGRCYVVA